VVHWLKHSPEADNVDWVVILDADQIVRGHIIPWELGAEKGKPFAAYYGYALYSLSVNLLVVLFSVLVDL
jgi:peptidyl serine alpha-galactosyltransferase